MFKTWEKGLNYENCKKLSLNNSLVLIKKVHINLEIVASSMAPSPDIASLKFGLLLIKLFQRLLSVNQT